MKPQHFTDRYRLIRSILIGSLVSIVCLPFFSNEESLTFAIAASLSFDLAIFLRLTWSMSIEQTRQVFSRFTARQSLVAETPIALVFMSVGLLSFCVSDLNSVNDVLPDSFHIFLAFISLFMTWLQLHNAFALYYAKLYYDMNPVALSPGKEQQGFVFAGLEPVFSDFLYISYSIGLTYSMTDCGVEDSSVRRVVIVHCISSFLFASTVLSVIFSLATQVNYG